MSLHKFYILTERLHGDHQDKLRIIDHFPSVHKARAGRARILRARFRKPIFDEPTEDPQWRRGQEKDLEIWKKIVDLSRQ